MYPLLNERQVGVFPNLDHDAQTEFNALLRLEHTSASAAGPHKQSSRVLQGQT